jgi:hypothetical protein
MELVFTVSGVHLDVLSGRLIDNLFHGKTLDGLVLWHGSARLAANDNV